MPSWLRRIPEVQGGWNSDEQIHEGHRGRVLAVAFSPDGKRLATASGDQTVRLWDAATGACEQTLKGHRAWVQTVAFSPDGKWLATASGDQTVRLWDAATGACEQALKGHRAWVQTVAFSPDGQLILLEATIKSRECRPATRTISVRPRWMNDLTARWRYLKGGR